MDVSLPLDGSYVVAISGGVDSMVLLDLLVKNNKEHKWQLIVCHIDHGIREDSLEDKILVERAAKKYDLVFEFTSLKLGKQTSEDRARQERYKFLRYIKDKYNAVAIITAHHQDDLLETAILNITRGTGRKGIASLKSSGSLIRPLLNFNKAEIIYYAKTNSISWHEDSTNEDQSYLRNYIRLSVIPKLSKKDKNSLLKIIKNGIEVNDEIDSILLDMLMQNAVSGEIDRYWFNMLDHKVSKEVLATWLRDNNIRDFNKGTLERLVIAAKTAKSTQQFPIINNYYLTVKDDYLALTAPER